MSSTIPIIASCSSEMSMPSREMTDNRLFQFYLESFFKIPKDISHDIIYCQRALKAHIKVHQMVLDVFQQQPDADPEQKKRILDELESEIYEINAEQNFLFLRLRRIIDEFMKMLKKNEIPTDAETTNAFISKQLVPLINDASLIINPTTVVVRNGEEKLIEKYFEVQKDTKDQDEPNHDLMEVIDLDDDDVTDEKQTLHRTYVNSRKREYSNTASLERESLLKSLNINMAATQPSLLKPFNQRMTHDSATLDVKPNINKPIKTLGDLYKKKKEENLLQQSMTPEFIAEDVKPRIIKPVKDLGEIYQQKAEETVIELPVSTNVKMSRLNLRQALKRAQAAVRGPTNVNMPLPTPQPSTHTSSSSVAAVAEVAKKSTLAKGKGNKGTGIAAATAAAATAAGPATAITVASSSSRKSPGRTSSSEGGTPERDNATPPQNYWPDEFEETRTKAEEYGQEMFLRMFDLFTPEKYAQMQQRRSKRRRRCVQNNSYHYGKIEHNPNNAVNDVDANKKKRKAFLLSPQVKKSLPAKRTKRRSADNVTEMNSASTSRSTSSSPDDKRLCNECLKSGVNLEQCEECKLHYHAQCHQKDDDPNAADVDLKKCPSCKRKHEKIIEEGLTHHQNLQRCAQDLELKFAKEKDRHEILERTGKSYKIQMHNLFKIVNSFKTQFTTSNVVSESHEDGVINLD